MIPDDQNDGRIHFIIHTPGRRQSKMPILSRKVGQKSIETEFSKTLFLWIFDQRLSIVDNVFDCPLSGVIHNTPC